MSLDDRSGDRQPHTGAVGQATVDSEEPLEHMCRVVRLQAAAFVGLCETDEQPPYRLDAILLGGPGHVHTRRERSIVRIPQDVQSARVLAHVIARLRADLGRVGGRVVAVIIGWRRLCRGRGASHDMWVSLGPVVSLPAGFMVRSS